MSETNTNASRPHVVGNRPDQTYARTIPAGESRVFQGLGDSFYISWANGPVRVKSKDLAERSYDVGTGKELPSGFAFEYLEFHNDNSFPIRIEVEISFGRFIDRRLNIVAGRGAALGVYPVKTEIEAEETLAAGNLANAAEVEFDPAVTPGDGRLQRAAVTISNNSTTARLLLLDAEDNQIGSVPANTIIELTNTDFFKLRNESGAGVDVKAFTTWVLDPFAL